ncbi:hypothetical protein [Natronoglomus mannanivorans]|uniref:Uncharacterized protein n=1 Tax=Natronoglomus mannanivorans TaxID=2979990 RepID=A0AAP3E372_9EURY|nr:hypothetical protein [Halobacteria archaeon AArc-xg1-1]
MDDTRLSHSQFLRARITVRDVLVHASIPLLLSLVYVSPITYESLLFRPGVSGLGETYLSTLGHADAGHLFGNVFGYGVLTSLSFVLLVGVGKRRLYYTLFGSILVFVPPLSSALARAYLELTAPDVVGTYRGAGFSIVTAGFVGLLGLSIAVHQRRTLDLPGRPGLASGCLFAVAGVVPAAVVLESPPGALVLGGIGLGYLVGSGVNAKRNLHRPDGPRAVALTVTAVLILLGVTSDLFLAESTRVGMAHAVGLLTGFFVVWTVVLVRWMYATVSGNRALS